MQGDKNRGSPKNFFPREENTSDYGFRIRTEETFTTVYSRKVKRTNFVNKMSIVLLIFCGVLLLLFALFIMLFVFASNGNAIQVGEGSVPEIDLGSMGPYVNLGGNLQYYGVGAGIADFATPIPDPSVPTNQTLTTNGSEVGVKPFAQINDSCVNIDDDPSCDYETFWWSVKPNIHILTWEELAPADQQWCLDIEGGTIQYFDHNNVPKRLTVDRFVCRVAITAERAGGAPAALVITVSDSENRICGRELNDICPTSYAYAYGPLQFLQTTFENHKPWPSADIESIVDSVFAASNYLKYINATSMFINGINSGAEGFIREFSCTDANGNRISGCAVWNYHRGQALAVYTGATKAQALRQELWGY